MLYGTTFEGAVEVLRRTVRVAALTRGAAGSLVVTPDEVVEVPAQPVDQLVDTTGAGDLYAAGFLYGYAQRLPLAECGRLGSVAAAEVITHTGARPLQPLLSLR